MSLSVEAGRARNIALYCAACGDTVLIPGGWDGPAIAAWSDRHEQPILAGWDVATGAGTVAHMHGDVPPLVIVRP